MYKHFHVGVYREKLVKMIIIFLSFISVAHADQPITNRIQQLSNDRVAVWKTTIYPSKVQELKMHRHEHDRVVIALTNGIIKLNNNNGQTHLMKLEKGSSYFLSKDPPNEKHTDENLSGHPIQVIVVDLK